MEYAVSAPDRSRAIAKALLRWYAENARDLPWRIAPGSDADLVVLDPRGETSIAAATQHQNVDYTPYEGFCLQGAIRSVYLRGTRLYADGEFLADDPLGRYVGRGASGAKEE
mgnify:CR=1 FL=1